MRSCVSRPVGVSSNSISTKINPSAHFASTIRPHGFVLSCSTYKGMPIILLRSSSVPLHFRHCRTYKPLIRKKKYINLVSRRQFMHIALATRGTLSNRPSKCRSRVRFMLRHCILSYTRYSDRCMSSVAGEFARFHLRRLSHSNERRKKPHRGLCELLASYTSDIHSCSTTVDSAETLLLPAFATPMLPAVDQNNSFKK